MMPGGPMLLRAAIALWAIIVYGAYWATYVPSR